MHISWKWNITIGKCLLWLIDPSPPAMFVFCWGDKTSLTKTNDETGELVSNRRDSLTECSAPPECVCECEAEGVNERGCVLMQCDVCTHGSLCVHCVNYMLPRQVSLPVGFLFHLCVRVYVCVCVCVCLTVCASEGIWKKKVIKAVKYGVTQWMTDMWSYLMGGAYEYEWVGDSITSFTFKTRRGEKRRVEKRGGSRRQEVKIGSGKKERKRHGKIM